MSRAEETGKAAWLALKKNARAINELSDPSSVTIVVQYDRQGRVSRTLFRTESAAHVAHDAQ